MSIHVSSAFGKVVHIAIWRINILIDFLIFNSPFNSSTSTSLINYFKDELKDLIVFINVSTKELESDFFVLFIKIFNNLMACVYLAICVVMSWEINTKKNKNFEYRNIYI
jgi:hypothetical protein